MFQTFRLKKFDGVKCTQLSRQNFQKIKLDSGEGIPPHSLPWLPTKCGYMSCQGYAALQLPKEPFTVHISALILREGRDRILPVPIDFLRSAVF